MADKTSNANGFTRDSRSRITAATATGMNSLKPMMHFQVSMLRMWADSIERFAGNYEKAWKKPRPRPLSRNSQTRNMPRGGQRFASIAICEDRQCDFAVGNVVVDPFGNEIFARFI